MVSKAYFLGNIERGYDETVQLLLLNNSWRYILGWAKGQRKGALGFRLGWVLQKQASSDRDIMSVTDLHVLNQ